MAQADGYVYIDTKLDQSELNSGFGKMKSVVTAGVAAMVASMGALSVAVINVGSEYEDAAAKVSTLVDENVNSMDKISENILAVSSRTGQAASELAEATYQALSAGIKGTEDEITGFVEQSAKLAKAGFTSTASAVDIVTTAINGYGMTVDDAEGITNQLIMTQNLGKTTVDELSATLGRVIPTASAFSVSLGNVNTAMAIMTASGINTAESSTYLKSMLNELGDTGSDVAGILLEKTGKSFTELMDEGKSLGDVMAILGESVDNDSTAFANLWSSAEAGTGALTILNGGTEKYNDTLNQIENSTAAVDDAYKKVTDTFSEKSKKVQESLKNVGIDAYNKFEKPLKGAMDSAQDAVNELSKEMSNGKLGKSVDTIADGFADLVKIAINLAKNTIPVLVNGFALVIDNGDKVAIALTAIGAATLYYKNQTLLANTVEQASIGLKTAGAAATLAYETIQAVLGGTLTATAGAHELLNIVMAASPVGAATLAVGALAAGLAALVICVGDNTSAFEENGEAIKEAKTSYDELNESKQEMLNQSLGEVENYQKLKKELDFLVDANGRVKEGYEARAEYIITTLNEAFGTEMKMVDGVIDKYDEASNQMNTYIEKMKASAILEAQAEAMKQAEELYKTNQQTLQSINEEQLQYQEDYDARLKELKDRGLSEEQIRQDASLAFSEAMITTTQTQKDNLMLLQEGILTDKATYYNNLELMQEGSLESLKLINTSEIAEYDEQGNRIETSLNDRATQELLNIQTLQETIKNTKDESHKKQLQREVEMAQENLAQIQSDLASQVDAVKGATPEQQQQYTLLSVARLEALKSQSDKYFGVSEKEMDDLLKGLNSKDKKVRKDAEDKAQKMLDGLKSKDDEYSKVGANVIAGITGGVNGSSGGFYSTMSNIATGALNTFKNILGIKSPSRKFAELSKFIPEGIAKGINDNEDKALTAIEDMSDDLVDASDFQVKGPYDDLINSFDPAFVTEQLDKIDSAIRASQAEYAMVANVAVQHEMAKIAQQNAFTDKIFKAALDGKIEVHVNIDGREAGIALAPIIAEELAFK